MVSINICSNIYKFKYKIKYNERVTSKRKFKLYQKNE